MSMSPPSTPPPPSRAPAAPAQPSPTPSDGSPQALLAQTARLAARGAMPHVAAAAAEPPPPQLAASAAPGAATALDAAAASRPLQTPPQQPGHDASEPDAAPAMRRDADGSSSSSEPPGDLSLDDGVHGELEAEVDDDAASGSVSRSGTLQPPSGDAEGSVGEGQSGESAAHRALAQRTAESEAQERARVQREKEAVDRALHAVVGSAMSKGEDAQAQADKAPEPPEGLPAHELDAQQDGEAAEDTESEEAEEEPHLKYSRLRNGAAEVLLKDSASAMAVSDRVVAMGTHAGHVHILDEQGNRIGGWKAHSASVLDLHVDDSNEFVGSAGMDGLVSIRALSSAEVYNFDLARPVRSLALEPSFGRRSSRAFVCGGMAGTLVLREKSWFGHRETVLHQGEGAISSIEWRGNLIAWSNEKGVRIYDHASKQRITFISPPSTDGRADLFRCSLVWQDDATLLIAWADHIKIAKVRTRNRGAGSGSSKSSTSSAGASAAVAQLSAAAGGAAAQLYVEITSIFKLDCMISGIAPHGRDYLVLAYISATADEHGDAETQHRRREGLQPELRIISHVGEELSSDVLSLQNVARYGCNDYLLVPSADAALAGARALQTPANGNGGGTSMRAAELADGEYFYIVSPRDVVVARRRDAKDAVNWLLERQRYAEALERMDAMSPAAVAAAGFDKGVIGRKYVFWLVQEAREYGKAARVAAEHLGLDTQAWEDLIFLFVGKSRLGTIIPYVPTREPTLNGLVYDMILAHFLRADPAVLLSTLQRWPNDIYSYPAVVLAIEDRLERDGSAGLAAGATGSGPVLMECLVELFLTHRQPGRALPYFLRLRRPGVFDLIRDHNLFTAVQDQALLLVQFEEELDEPKAPASSHATLRPPPVARRTTSFRATHVEPVPSRHGAAIDLLVDHTHSIPIHRVVAQLSEAPRYLHKYLDALFDRDPQLTVEFSNVQVKLYADYDYEKLMPYLRAMSSYYSFEDAYNVCKERDLVPEMVFLLGRVGDNKKALNLIISRLGDVERAIDFAKEQNDDELWEDLLKYSETKPAFIRGLLENVGAEIDPIRLIRRIKNGLEIPGLKPALIKILSDFNLQISLLEGSAAILYHDGRNLSHDLHVCQTQAHYCDDRSVCAACGEPLFIQHIDAFRTAHDRPAPGVFFLCRHAFHLTCLVPAANMPRVADKSPGAGAALLPPLSLSATQAYAKAGAVAADGISGPARRADEAAAALTRKMTYEARLRVVLRAGCPECRRKNSERFA